MATELDPSHPYSPALVSGDLVFVSGALSVDTDGRAVPGRYPALVAAFRVLEERLSSVGADLADVVKLTYYVDDVTLREEANEHFLELFDAPRPARTFVEVSRLPYGASVEVDAIAQSRRVSAFPAR